MSEKKDDNEMVRQTPQEAGSLRDYEKARMKKSFFKMSTSSTLAEGWSKRHD